MRKSFILLIFVFSLNIFSCPRKEFHDEVINSVRESNGILRLTEEAIIIDINKMEIRYQNMLQSVFQNHIYKPLLLNLKLFAMNHSLKVESQKDGKKIVIF